MATFEVTEGAPGQGKSLYTAMLAERLIKRNAKWHLKGNPIRKVVSNIRFSDWFEEEYREFISYWSDTNEVVNLRDCDLIWDEIATELDSRNFANLSIEMKRFLSQYRKRGVDIYANTQDFSMIDMRARLMITKVRTLTKVIGSSDISTTKPPPKRVWGLILIRDVENYKETDPAKKKYGIVPDFMLIERRLVSIYDTRQDIPLGKPAPLKHIEVECELRGKIDPETGKIHDCQYHRIIHQ